MAGAILRPLPEGSVMHNAPTTSRSPDPGGIAMAWPLVAGRITTDRVAPVRRPIPGVRRGDL